MSVTAEALAQMQGDRELLEGLAELLEKHDAQIYAEGDVEGNVSITRGGRVVFTGRIDNGSAPTLKYRDSFVQQYRADR